jgi:3-phenylpropionate/trans-cinnamate dioxygenase ferredoxin subunit
VSWTPAAAVTDIAPGKVIVIQAAGRSVAVCNTGDGIHAIDDICSHDGGALGQGELTDGQIECPRHGARFDVKTGKALCLPAVRPVRTYNTRVAHGNIEIEIP